MLSRPIRSPPLLWRARSCCRAFLAVVLASCATASSNYVPVQPTSVAVIPAAEEHHGFRAYMPEGLTDSIVYVDFAAIRESEVLRETVASVVAMVIRQRPDISAYYATVGLQLVRNANTMTLASTTRFRSWVSTTDYANVGLLDQALGQAAPDAASNLGDFSVRQILGQSRAARLVARPLPRRVVVGTPDGVEAAASSTPADVDFFREGAVAAVRLRGMRSPLSMPAQPTEIQVALFTATADPDKPFLFVTDFEFEEVSEAESVLVWATEGLAELQQSHGIPQMILNGASFDLRRDDARVVIEARVSNEAAAVAATFIVASLRP